VKMKVWIFTLVKMKVKMKNAHTIAK
jgi:hypothetical protein